MRLGALVKPVAPIAFILGMFWLDAVRYVGLGEANGLDPALYRAISYCFLALFVLWVLRAWRIGNILKGLIGWLICVVAGELPWRLASRGHLDWIWSRWGWDSTVTEKIAAGECLWLTPCVLAIIVLGILVEAVRLVRSW